MPHLLAFGIVAQSVHWFSGWKLSGSFTSLDLIAATTNALNGALLARRPPLYRGWEEPLAKEPTGVYLHDDGRPLLGRKLKGKSQRELRGLGLAVDAQPNADGEGENR